jgi:N-acetyl-gamma-glutamyl-phosphate reductase
MPTIPVAILGPTGYTGLELLELLARHPAMHAAYLGSARTPPPRIDAEFPRLLARLHSPLGTTPAQCEPLDHDAIAARTRLAFLCLPHEAAMTHAPALLARGVKVVDLSAAYRLRDAAVYAAAYGHPHTDALNLPRAVYGLPELNRAAVAGAQLVANPGCYPTAAAVALAPFLRAGAIDPASIIVNAASGASGAGREAKPHLTLVEAGDNFSAYGIGVHRHQPEIGQSLRTFGTPGAPDPLFVPHLLPIERGILETVYATPAVGKTLDTARATATLREAYASERFVVVRDEAPTLRDAQRTNRVHVNARVVGGRLVVVAAIDNLVKGASGQAIQNANLMLGLPEDAGLV